MSAGQATASTSERRRRPRQRVAPEVVQTSAMDCGPASLKCVLDGHGLPVSYARLRDVCQTDVDGTSIDTMETVANQLGLPAEQVVIPVDHVLLESAAALPAIAVVQLSDRLTHFVVLWNRVGPFVQVMDPASGRRWMRAAQVHAELYRHRTVVPAATWHEWAASSECQHAFVERLAALGAPAAPARQLVAHAAGEPQWRALAAIDAVTRLTQSLVRSGGVRRGREAWTLVTRLCDELAAHDDATAETLVPSRYWTVRPDGTTDEGLEHVAVTGAVLVRFPAAGVPDPRLDAARDDAPPSDSRPEPGALGPEAVRTLRASAPRPWSELARMLLRDGAIGPPFVAAVIAITAVAVAAEAVLFRALVDVSRHLALAGQRLAWGAAIVAFAAIVMALEWPVASWLLAAGRRLDARLRLRLLETLPTLGDAYFRSRLTSDLAERMHSVHVTRQLPLLAGRVVRLTAELVATSAGIIWLDPEGAVPATLLALLTLAAPLLAHPWLTDLELRMRTHGGALSRYYLDALHGLVPVRTHGAERAIRREHARVLGEWARSADLVVRTSVLAEATQLAVGAGFAVWMLWGHLARGGEAASLLLIYWVLRVPVLGDELGAHLRQYPATHNTMMRLLEPLASESGHVHESAVHEPAPEAPVQVSAPDGVPVAAGGPHGVSIAMRDVSVVAAGRALLREVNLTIPEGAHVAIVGRSGAGKSTLAGLLLGWHTPVSGDLMIDGSRLDAHALGALRRHTAWVDPAVQLWNRGLVDNLRYGAETHVEADVSYALEATRLQTLIERLPEGLQTALGEGGALVSGGEGQRVRLARALLRPDVRLVVLDEAFRGLDRSTRRALLALVREQRRHATLLCISHDVEETLAFERVLVVDDGVVVEDGPPSELASGPSRFQALLAAERDVHARYWSGDVWRRIDVERGYIVEPLSSAGHSAQSPHDVAPANHAVHSEPHAPVDAARMSRVDAPRREQVVSPGARGSVGVAEVPA